MTVVSETKKRAASLVYDTKTRTENRKRKEQKIVKLMSNKCWKQSQSSRWRHR